MNFDSTLQHGRDYRGEDLAGWLLSEKHDGCRGYWNGRDMLTRGGNIIAIPQAWREALPPFPLDGELHAGRGGFQRARVAVQCGRITPSIRFTIFDAPGTGLWRERFARAAAAVAGLDFAEVVEVVAAESTEDALHRMQMIMDAGGEGMVARHPRNLWRPGRTGEVVKLKVPRSAMWFLECRRAA